MATLEAIRPYVESLLDDTEVHKQLSRAASDLRAARSRADKAKNKKRMVQDERLRQRIVDAVSAVAAAGSALSQAPQKQKRSRRGPVLLVLVLAGAAVVAANGDARNWVMQRLGMAQSEAA